MLLGKIVEKCGKHPEQPFEYGKMLLFFVTFFQISIDFCRSGVYNEAIWSKREVMWSEMERRWPH